MKNFTMVRKNMDHSLDEIKRWRNIRYPTEITWRHQIVGDSTKLSGVGTKICGKYLFFIL
jgi:hypothetical protein